MDSAVRMADGNAGEVGAEALKGPKAAELSVILPSFNEAANIPILIGLLDEALAGIAWEAIVVDDNSPDGTTEVAREIARTDARVRVIRRIGRRGLSGPVLRASWRPPPPLSPSWMRTCSTTRPCCRRCWPP